MHRVSDPMVEGVPIVAVITLMLVLNVKFPIFLVYTSATIMFFFSIYCSIPQRFA